MVYILHLPPLNGGAAGSQTFQFLDCKNEMWCFEQLAGQRKDFGLFDR